MLPKSLTSEQEDLLTLYQSAPPPMKPLDFLKYWDVDYPMLAQITRVSRSTVEHWFSVGISTRPPSPDHCRRIAIVHFLWTNIDRIPPVLLTLWQRR